METITLKPTNNDAGQRIDKVITANSDLTRSYVQNLLAAGNVYVNNKPVNKNYKVSVGDEISYDLPDPQNLDVQPENIPLDIVYNDDDVIVVNKPQGMVVHPAAGNYTGTLVNALLYHFGSSLSAINGVVRPGIVHRIDKDTSGLLMIAKNNDAHLSLASQLKEHKALRKYIALVHGHFKEKEGIINKPIDRNPVDRKKMAIVPNGREAITHYRVLEEYIGYSLIECVLETGRTHQIRVHMCSTGHPIVGDYVYSKAKDKFKTNGQLLHAKTLAFMHPKTNELMKFDSELPEYFTNIVDRLKQISE